MSTLTKTSLVTLHKAALGNAAKKFAADSDADLVRHIDKAVSAFSRIRRRTLVATLDLQPDVSDYPAPADIIAPKVSRWGQTERQPWQPGYGPLPRMRMFEGDNGLMINLHPAPNAAQIACHGSQYPFFYLALHKLSDQASETTIREADQDLFLLVAMIEALTELVASGVTEPVSLQRGMGSVNNNMTPSAALEVLTKRLEQTK